MPQMQESVERHRPRFLPIPWRILLIGWGLYSIVGFVDRGLWFGSLRAAALLTVINYPLLMLTSVALCRSYERLFPERRVTAMRMATLIGMCFAAGFCLFTVSTAIRIESGWSQPDIHPLETFVVPAGQHATAILAWSLLYFWIETETHRRVEQQHLAQVQVAATGCAWRNDR